MQIVHYNDKLARLYVKASGFWTLDEVTAHNDAILAACRAVASAGRRIAILADTTGYLPQGGAVGDVQEKLPAAFVDVQIDKIAVVAPSALVRMGTRRRLQGVPHEIFEELKPALAWLDWSPAYVAQCGG